MASPEVPANMPYPPTTPNVAYSRRGRRVLFTCSYATGAVSLGYAFAYMVNPGPVDRSLLGSLSTPLVWAAIQAGITVMVVVGQLIGRHAPNVVHTIAGIIQTVYFGLWMTSALLTGNGWFITPGIAMAIVVHWSLAGTLWTRMEESRQ